MRKITLALALVLTTAMQCAFAGPRDDAMALIDRWLKAFTDSDVDAIVSLYGSNPVFFGTYSRSAITTTEGVRAYFEQVLRNNKPHDATLRDTEIQVLNDSVVVISALDSHGGVVNGDRLTSEGRVTFVLQALPSGWFITHFHRSPVPRPANAG
jgi:ketosteroid isomerase-like protein